MPRTPSDLTRAHGDVQLATLVTAAAAGRWSYQLPWDGYRILAMRVGIGGAPRQTQREGLGRAVPEVAGEIAKISARE
jgi:hypothetical protein